MTNLPAHTTVVCAVPLGPQKGFLHQKRYLLLPCILFWRIPRNRVLSSRHLFPPAAIRYWTEPSFRVNLLLGDPFPRGLLYKRHTRPTKPRSRLRGPSRTSYGRDLGRIPIRSVPSFPNAAASCATARNDTSKCRSAAPVVLSWRKCFHAKKTLTNFPSTSLMLHVALALRILRLCPPHAWNKLTKHAYLTLRAWRPSTRSR